MQNVLSISTAGKNRYLLHFNSHHSLIQWTAGIRLSMFEHATLQEAYTGALIAGKGKSLNNINLIMERTKIKTEDWARVRFGAGTPWRRCWCVVTPPDEKEVMKLQKQVNKKKSAYDRSKPPTLRGDIKFYDSKKTKKVNPIATITDAHTAYAIYPQAKALIDQSTLVKVEGSITIHSNPPSTTEGFVFVMPDVHPAVTGFEMMLRWLFPVFDTFALYGRPGRLIADTTNPESLMFAMPKHRRYGYLEILDVSGLILEQGSSTWRDSEWRRRMKDLTQKRMAAIENGTRPSNRFSSTPSRRSTRNNSFGPSRSRIQFDDGASTRSSPSVGWSPPTGVQYSDGIPRTDSAPPTSDGFAKSAALTHNRSVSETQGIDRYGSIASNYDGAYENAPSPPIHQTAFAPAPLAPSLRYKDGIDTPSDRVSSEDESHNVPVEALQGLHMASSPEPVAAPPAFSHNPGALPATKPYHSAELRRANSRMSHTTLDQITNSNSTSAVGGITAQHAGATDNNGYEGEELGHGVLSDANNYGFPANRDGLIEGSVDTTNIRKFSFDGPSPQRPAIDTHRAERQPAPQFTFPGQPRRDNNTSSTRTYDSPQPFLSSSSQQHHAGQSHIPRSSADSTSSPGRVNRKPLPNPSRNSLVQTPDSAEANELPFHKTAFDMIKAPIDRTPTTTGTMTQAQRERAESTADSVYEDIVYDDEPDYASTYASTIGSGGKPLVSREERPRAGVMKTVGLTEESRTPNAALPNIDFGPTLNLASGRASPSSAQSFARATSPSSGNSYDMPPPVRPDSSGNRSPTRNAYVSEGQHYRHDSGEGRTVAWQPGMSSMNLNSSARSPALTPEQFVQQRAAVPPMYAHQRSSSSQNILGNGGLVKNFSGDRLAQLGGHSRQSSADLLQRPNSRGPAGVLGAPAGNGDMPTSLSAREQEHVARATGQPLINMAGNKGQAGAGLVGAIETREKEKQQMKQGINSSAVQHAIAQRQFHGTHQQYPESGYGAPQLQSRHYPQYATQSQPQHQPWVPPTANAYAQGGGYAAPSPNSLYDASPEQRAMYSPPPQVPGMSYSPSQQFSPAPQRPQQGPGRGGYQNRPQY